MGIESDKLVYDYLSRVGDLAQTAMASADRMRLVAQLRTDIDRQRGGSDSQATVRRILGKLGTPDEVVEAAARDRPVQEAQPRHEAAPAPTARNANEAPSPDKALSLDKPPTASDERGSSAAEPEWWRVPPARDSTDGGGIRGGLTTNEVLAGWSGGLLPPELDEPEEGEAAEAEAGQDADPPVEAAPRRFRLRRPRTPTASAEAAPRRFRLRRPRTLSAPAEAVRRRGLPVGPLELLAALALVAGVVLGNWLALGAGWLLAYTTRGIGRGEAKFAALGLPGVVVLGELIWVWGRTEGRWGTPLATNQLGQTITADFPTVVKVAAIGSALFLLWRSAARR
ncbi:hypothetical protein [Streptantibioticus ferralitis]|uniref:Integral membrane protein n=1 Tax=Streptantibioticus ferralitis TaxID=236510 RepID=A0ABT5ZBK5_9ACTN|nr:hypothetical protein [Streptantibioticus ferralitis]MDF2261220.1 hypothetical protein [Streptantibioticus ferralitis]